MEAWIDVFHFVQSLRMTYQHKQLAAGGEADNYIDPDQPNPLDRRT